MKRAIKITIVCPIDIDEVDANDLEDLESAELDAVKEELFSTEHLCHWDELQVEDMCEWED